MTRSFDVTLAVCLFLLSTSAFGGRVDGRQRAAGRGTFATDNSAGAADELYRRREDLASAARAAALWAETAATDYDSAWKLARAHYWIGTHAPESERRAALERGVSAGEMAVGLQPARPEGHFWLAANMGVLAQSFGVSQG